MNEAERSSALNRLYELLQVVRGRIGQRRRLAECTGRMDWPNHGVYLVFEPGETREDGETPRVVRVGTHALTSTSRTTLWGRLRAHRGTVGGSTPGGGNHRGSIFRLHVGDALIARDGWTGPARTWGEGSSAPRDVRQDEVPLERAVSEHLGAMELLWLPVSDRHERAEIERGLIGLLSNFEREPIDPPTSNWLGRHSSHPMIQRAGLWNVHHVDRRADSEVLVAVEDAVARTGPDRVRSAVTQPNPEDTTRSEA